jgi:hypothetical protein
MSCAPTDRLMQTLRVEAPGAPDSAIELALFNTMDEFFRRTQAWQHPQDIMLSEGQPEYPFTLPSGATVVRAISVTHQGVNVMSSPVAGTSGGQTRFSLGALLPDEVFPDGDAMFAPAIRSPDSNIFTYAIYRPEYLTVTGSPDEEARKHPLQVWLALSVARSCLDCGDCSEWLSEDWMYDMFFQDWLDGTLSRLMATPAKPWTNKEMMIYHGKRFRVAMAQRKQESMRGFNWDKPMWRFPGTWVR